jgi:DNA-binding MarR family transcriptional regulator
MQSTAVDAKQLAGTLGVLWGQLMRADEGGMFRLISELDLAMTQVKSLFILNACSAEPSVNPELSVNQLAERIGLSLPAASRTIEGLLKRGLVERREDQHDRRIKRVRITDAGHAAVTQIAEARLHGLEAFAETLTDEQRHDLHTALTAIFAPKD